MVELCRGWNAQWHAACAGALLAAALGATVRAQSMAAIAGQRDTSFSSTPPAPSDAGGAPLLSYRRDDGTNNPLRPAGEPAVATAVVPATATALSPGDAAAQGLATAAFAPAEPPISYDAPATPLLTAEPMTTAPPAATAPVGATQPGASLPQALAAEPGLPPPVATPAFTLPASASDPIAPAHAGPTDASARRLAPAGGPHGGSVYRGGGATKSTLVPTAFGQLKSLASAGGALALVVGLFVACALLLRRGGPKPTGMLPAEAFAVLGRAPLTPQSFAQLLRLGNKLVLVAVTADGAQPLAEVDDPAEVDRIAGLCLSGRGAGPSAEFQQVLAQLSREPAKGFLGREGSTARRRA